MVHVNSYSHTYKYTHTNNKWGRKTIGNERNEGIIY